MATPRITVQIGADTSRLNRDLKKGQTTIQKFGSAAMRAMDGLAIAAAGAAVAIGKEGVEAAIADQAAQVKLAKTLQNTTKATNAQVAATEDYIDKTQRATGVADDELRPSLDRLVRSTRNVSEAQKLQALALDVAAGTGKDLSAVTEAIAKAYDGNYASLKRLGVPIDENIMKTKDFDAATKMLSETFEGQAAAAAETAAGSMARFQIGIDEAKESIGEALLPTLTELTDYLNSPEGQKFIQDFALAMSDAFKAAAEALPTILKGMKAIGNVAAELNLDFSTLMDPKLLAAAAAFRVTPGPVQVKAIAALAAYGAVTAGEDVTNAAIDSKNSFLQGQFGSMLPPSARTGTTYVPKPQGKVLEYGSPEANAAYEKIYGNMTRITVNAVDPVSTSRAIAKIVNGGNGNGSSNKVGTRVR